MQSGIVPVADVIYFMPSQQEQSCWLKNICVFVRFNLYNTKPLASLVADGTITQAQADKVGPTIRGDKGQEGSRGPEGRMKKAD